MQFFSRWIIGLDSQAVDNKKDMQNLKFTKFL